MKGEGFAANVRALWQKDEWLFCFINWLQEDRAILFTSFCHGLLLRIPTKYGTNDPAFKSILQHLCLHFSPLCQSFLPLSLLRPPLALNRAQLSAVTHCHSFISSLHHSFWPSTDLGIHLSIHLSAPFSLTSGNDEKRHQGEEERERRWEGVGGKRE